MINGDRIDTDGMLGPWRQLRNGSWAPTPEQLTAALAAADQERARKRTMRVVKIVLGVLAGVAAVGALVLVLSACVAMSPAPAVHPSPTPYPKPMIK